MQLLLVGLDVGSTASNFSWRHSSNRYALNDDPLAI
jgi:hypothetical protein